MFRILLSCKESNAFVTVRCYMSYNKSRVRHRRAFTIDGFELLKGDCYKIQDNGFSARVRRGLE